MASAAWVAGSSIALLLATGCGGATDGPAPNGAKLTGIEHGDTVASPVTVGMEADGIDIVSVAEPRPGEGHFHILVDQPCVEGGTAIPRGEGYHHFDDGESRAELDLEPGEHTLCLQVGDGSHTAVPPPRPGPIAHHTHEISVTVEG